MIPKSKLRFTLVILILGTIALLPLIARAQTPISCGQTLSGSISTTGERDAYSFTASANDSLTIRTRKTSGSFIAYLDLYSPSGSLLQSGNQIDRTLTEAGTYRIDVRDQSNTNTGDYFLYWEKMSNPCNATAFSCDQVANGSIGTGINPPPWKVYTFTASANDAVTIRARKVSGETFIPLMELYGPAGNFIASAYNYPLDRVLTASGAYKILMRDYYNAYGGDFTLIWRKVSAPPCSSASISCGQVVSGSIGASDAMYFYTFTASANDSVTIRVRKTSGTFTPSIEVYDPHGSRVVDTPSQSINTTLTVAGAYTLLVRDLNNVNTGGYFLYWERMNNPCHGVADLGCAQVVTGSIGTGVEPPPWRVYTFTASANDTVSISAGKTSGGTFIPLMELYDPTGSYIASGYNYPLNKVLTASGTYKILIRDYYNAYEGNYVLTWLKLISPCNAKPISCGQTLSGSVSPAVGIQAYTFTATAGDNVALTLTKTSGEMDPSLELYSSSGTRIAYQYTTSGNQVTVTQTLSAGGSYTVFVSDYGNDETGDYQLKFQRNNNSCPEVIVMTPNGGERIVTRSIFTIRWTSTDQQGISSQEVRLSTDGGLTFSTILASGLPGNVQSYQWSIPADLVTNQGRIRVTSTATSGISTPDDSDADFTIFQGLGRTYVYDELNRLSQVIYGDGTTVTYTYDNVGNRLVKEVRFTQETISTPSTPSGPTSGAQGTSYSYTVRGSSSNLLHPVQYFIDWGDGTNSGWLPAGTASASKSWAAAGDYTIKTQARCASHNSLVSSWSGTLWAGITSPSITLQSPSNGAVFNSCSLILTHQPSFNWTPTGTFTQYTILLSTSPTDFTTQGVLITKATLAGTTSNWVPTATLWKTILTSSHNKGNIRDIYWKVIGTKADKKTVESPVRSFGTGDPQKVTIVSPPNNVTLPSGVLPSFEFNSNCNIKFTLEISSLGDFSSPIKIKSFIFTTKDPNVETVAKRALTSLQWNSVKTLIGKGQGYFRIKAWDGINRETISEVGSFTIQ